MRLAATSSVITAASMPFFTQLAAKLSANEGARMRGR
jgi:hypothetical protein